MPALRTSGSSKGFLCRCVIATEGVMLALLQFELYSRTFWIVATTEMLNGDVVLMLLMMGQRWLEAGEILVNPHQSDFN